MRRGIRGRDRIVGFLARAVIIRILTHDRGVAAILARSVLHLHDSGEIFIVRIVHLHRGLPESLFAGDALAALQLLCGEALRLEAQGAVGQAPVLEIVVFINRPRVNQVLELHMGQNLAEIRVEENLYLVAASLHHALEHPRVAGFGECLEFLAQVAIVAVGANRNATAHRGIQVLGMALPLLERVALEKLLIQFPAHLADDHFLGIRGVFDRHALGFDPLLHLLRGGRTTKDLLEGVQIDRKVPIAVVRVGENLIVDRVPLGELAEVVFNLRRICSEIVGSVGVDEHTMVVILVIGISTNVVAFFDNERGFATLRGGPLGEG